jgi:hypothetical protein
MSQSQRKMHYPEGALHWIIELVEHREFTFILMM